jgi:replicative DNA helicase
MPDGITPLFGLSQRLPPSNLQAEQALLGAIMANPKAYEAVSEFLRPIHFADSVHGRIYQAICTLSESGRLADAVTLKAAFEGAGLLDEVGGTVYLSQLLTAMVGIINAREYGLVIQDLWMRRQAISIGEELVNNAFDGTTDFRSMAAGSAEAIDDLSSTGGSRRGTFLADAMAEAISFGEAARKAAEDGTARIGITTGFPKLDEMLGDLEGGEVYFLAARPAVGKSAIGLQISVHNALNGIPVEYCSTEMQARQLGRRALALLTGVSSQEQRRGTWHQSADKKLQDAWARVAKARETFEIQDVPGMNIPLIRAKGRAFSRKHKGTRGLLVVDHMHDLEEMSEDKLFVAIGNITRGLKSIAKALDWPVLVLAQLNRNIDGREEKKPEVSDLYGGMQIEAVAQAIMLLHRPDKYLNPSAPDRKFNDTDEKYSQKLSAWQDEWKRLQGRLQMFIPKVREGTPGYVQFTFDGPSNRSTEEDVPDHG